MIFYQGELFAVDPRFEGQVIDTVQKSQAQQYSVNAGNDRPSMITELPLSGVAFLQICGPVYRGSSYWCPTWDTLVRDLLFLDSRQSVTEVRILIDSPGGSAMGCQEACDVVGQMSKPVVAFIQGYGCSAAYRFACHCDQIFATKSAQIGSIGTLLTVLDLSKMFENDGVEVVAATTGEFKSFGHRGLPVTAEHRQFMAERVAIDQAGFVASLAARGLTAEQQAAVTDGRYWSAEEALQLKLIDGIKSVAEVTSGAVLLVGGSGSSSSDVPAVGAGQLGSAGQLEGGGIVSGGTGQPAAKTGEVQAVSIAEIEQLCPGASPEFVLQQAKIEGNTSVKVLQAFAALQSQEIEQLKKTQADAAAAASQQAQAAQQAQVEQQRLASVVGTAPVGSTALTQTAADGSGGKSLEGGPIQQFEGLVDESVKAGMTRQAAVMSVVQEHRELHGQYLTAIRQMTPEQVAARRLKNVGSRMGREFVPAK